MHQNTGTHTIIIQTASQCNATYAVLLSNGVSMLMSHSQANLAELQMLMLSTCEMKPFSDINECGISG